MAEKTKIQWADHTFNPWWGCTRVSPACTHCYAESLARRFKPGTWGASAERAMASESQWAQPREWNARAQKARARTKEGYRRPRVFCASMSDVFEELHEEHPQRQQLADARHRLWGLIAETPQLDWMLLTKRPQNIDGSGLPKLRNIWLGTTVENYAAYEARVPHLLQVEGPYVKFLSCEPMLEAMTMVGEDLQKLDWVIAGGESGPGARPMHPDWLRCLKAQCQAYDIPFFFKQWGAWAPVDQVPKLNGAKVKLSEVAFVPIGYQGFKDETLPVDGSNFVKMVRLGAKKTEAMLDGKAHRSFPRQIRLC